MVGWLDERVGDFGVLGAGGRGHTRSFTSYSMGVTDNYKVISCFLHVRGREPKVESLVA